MNNLYLIYVLNNMIDDVTNIKTELNLKLCKTSKTIVNYQLKSQVQQSR